MTLAGRWRQGAVIAATAGLLTFSMTVAGQGQGNDLAAMQVRLDQLEEQVRLNSGQIEGLQFQLTQLQSLLERTQEDNEYRFQQLEGGSLGETDAATPSGGETPAERLPQENQSQTEPAPSDQTVIDPLVGDSDIMDGSEIGGEDNLYASDVFAQEQTEQDADDVVLGPPEGELGSTPPSEPLDLSFDPDAIPLEDGDANAQYQAGYDAVVRGEYAFAENQFRQFIESFPDHQQAPDATYWLGETLIQRAAYGEAAEVLLDGFESYPTSTRAPDLLFNLGIALHGAGEFDTACRTYGEVLRRYPESTGAFRDRVIAEQARAGC
ncbi:TPR repeat containing exported protein, putative periplasmic protein contains a protein prenylyltransferase domain [Pelagibacterium halotolerans B2]|uniref:Cell division coordinator CpoB n=2 Tax=Pelagibacterium TaxID=1082930 RepID=G4R976_PELHB|nr:TPR repeat containing exported protein, putative periplasmic protein contains a protein prenylyltransferase domain [Pelagibacterium halotolerans B2]